MASKSGQSVQTLTPPSSPESMSTSGLLRVTAPAPVTSGAGAIVRVTARAGGSLPRFISFSSAATAVAFQPAAAAATAAATLTPGVNAIKAFCLRYRRKGQVS